MFFRQGSKVAITNVYESRAKLKSLSQEWQKLVSAGANMSVSPFLNPEEFDYNTEDFLYYRARALTANVVNINGDWFDHDELKKAYNTFVGKGVYFNHDSENPDKAFGIILAASYTPVYFNDDNYTDRYVELLGAVHRKACKEKRPGLLEDIETGRMASTSMGVIAKSARCSICNTLAHNKDELCEHTHPENIKYAKGRLVDGQPCFEYNYGLTFIEDSFVYVPADPTAKVLEIYASVDAGLDPTLTEHLTRYSSALSERQSAKSGGHTRMADTKPAPKAEDLVSEMASAVAEPAAQKVADVAAAAAPAQAAAPKAEEKPKKGGKTVQDYQDFLSNMPNLVKELGAKYMKDSLQRMMTEETRKHLSEMSQALTKGLRESMQPYLAEEVDRAREEIKQVLPGVSLDLAPATASVKENPVVILTEDFSKWPAEDRLALSSRIMNGETWSFYGEVEK